MVFVGITAAVLAALVSMCLNVSPVLILPVFLVCVCAVGLVRLAQISGMLIRSCCAVAVLIAALASAQTVALWTVRLWTFIWVFALADAILILLALLFLVLVCARVDLNKPQEHDDPVYRRIMYVYIEALMNLVLVNLHTKGLEKTPKEGRFLLVCNHLFLADPGILLHCFPKSQLAFITKQENLTMPIINKFMHKILCQPMDRENDRQALKVILKCIQLIKDDEVSIGVFPEGYTSKDGLLHHFRAGVFKIAQKANVPIVVCTIQNTRQIFPNLAKLRRTDVELHLVDVIPAEDLAGRTTVDIANQVYEMMISDLGEAFRTEQ